VLQEDVILGNPVILQADTMIPKGSVLAKGTQIARGSVVYEGLAPGASVLPACNTILLDSSGSTDPDGNPLTFSWDFGDGVRAYGERITHTFLEPGTYVVNLVATDDSGAINDAASKALTIFINAPPVAVVGDHKWACPGETVYFDGTKSYDPDGVLTALKWFFGDGASEEGAAVSHAYENPGMYSVRLDVLDNSDSVCSVDSDSLVVIVNDPPVADAGDDVTGCDATIQFDGTGSFDPDGAITEYVWYFGDGTVGSGPTPKHTYAQPGVYTVRLEVSDGSEATCNVASDEIVVAINAAPAVDAGPDQQVCVNTEVSLDGSGTLDKNDDPLMYVWDFGDGTPGSDQISVGHTYTTPGQYTATLTVQDDSNTACTT
jgi:PKD repeat protein